ncbi:Threonine efflux protein [Roseobacter fucihabitans]|uniref:Threonine efflux protein n=1 Tax=Roseobacter fucihabitans TaxID=1537242 RepID=A0ABZ2BRW0_9RHOB|nr:LysE family transporter [Roseobacter litoralis]MBC6965619.1 Threonine efflux protein [Roseobacter litoralis]
MSVESLIAFNLVLMAAIASPGAALLYFIKTCVASGRAAGFATGLGLGLAAAGWTLAALLGLESLFALFPWAYTLLKITGALYLIWIAVQTWRHARDPVGEIDRPKGRALLSGLLVNIGNPKSMLFAAAVILVVFPQGLNAMEITLIVANHLALEVVFYGLFAVLLSSAPARRGYLNAKPILDRIAATLLGALGLRLLVERT